MTTRSGRGYKSSEMDGAATTQTGGEDPADRGEAGTDTPSNMPAVGTDITSLMQFLLEDRRRREEEIAEERVRREREVEKRVEQMKEQMDAMFKIVEQSTKGRKNSGEALVKVAKLIDSDEIEGYLLTFERQMAAYEIDKSRWAFILAPQLTGRAQKAYMALATDEASDYSAIKQAILKRYDISEETHRRKFRERSRGKGESYTELATSLVDLANRWLEDCSSKSDVLEKIAIEHFLSKASEDVRVWVREHKPTTCAEAGYWADEFLLARNDTNLPSTGTPKLGPRRCHTCNQVGHLANNCPTKLRESGAPNQAPPPWRPRPGPMPSRHPQQPQLPQQYTTNRPIQCYSCGKIGHIAANCRENAMFCDNSEDVLKVEVWEGVVRQGLVEGVPVEVLLDTGSARTLVRKELVPEGKVMGEGWLVSGAHTVR